MDFVLSKRRHTLMGTNDEYNGNGKRMTAMTTNDSVSVAATNDGYNKCFAVRRRVCRRKSLYNILGSSSYMCVPCMCVCAPLHFEKTKEETMRIIKWKQMLPF